MLAEDLGPDVEHAFAVPGTRARPAVVRDVGRQERDLRSLHATVSPLEVVGDRSLVDREDGPGVVRVRRVGVVDEPGVEDLVDPGHLGLPRANPLHRPFHDARNVQDRRRSSGFDERDGIEVGSSPMLNDVAALVAFAFVGSFSPGPNNAVLWASGISFGFRRTVPQIVGAALGVGALVVAVAAGIGAFLEAVPAAALALKMAGSVYLLYVAWRVAGSGAIAQGEAAHPLSVWEAAVFQWLNPKAWVFAIALAGTFLPEDLASAGIALLAGIVVAVVAVSFTIWAAGGAALARFVADERRRRIVNLLLAGLIAASVALLWI
jgi:threonine/homoserine/homoserine lactone efflux protein